MFFSFHRGPRSHRQGFALLTGLFFLSVLYLMATVVASNAELNFSFTRQSLEAAQAQASASAGTCFALHELNQATGEAWEADRKVTPYVDPSGAFKVTIRDAAADRIYIEVVGIAGGKEIRKRTLVKKKPAVEPVKYCTMNGVSDSSQPDTVWRMDSRRYWLPMLEPFQFQNPPGTFPFSWAVAYAQPAGDSHGNMYVIADHPGQGRDILYWEKATNTWKLCPNVPIPSGYDPTPWISDLAVQPDSGCFAFVRYTDSGGMPQSTRIHYLSSPTDPAWQTIPQIPGSAPAITNPGPPIPPGNGGLWDFSSIACDGDKLYALQRDANRIYRFTPSAPDWSAGTWDQIPVPLTKVYAVNPAGQLQGPYPDAAHPLVRWLMFLAVDPGSGQVFARAPTTTTVDTIYRYAPDPANPANSVWSADPLPAPGYHFSRASRAWRHFGGVYPDLVNYIVDHSANLSAYWSRDDEDTHYTCDLTQKGWQLDPPVSFMNPTVNEVGPTAANCTGLGGGGIEELGRTKIYVPLYSD